jgi:D-alanyl-D-alanine carboxypeptidase
MLGTVLLQLDTEGVLAQDAPVAKYFPELVNGDQITARMLADSTGGTPDYMTDPEFGKALNADPFKEWTVSELLAYAQRTPPLFAPGTSWAYSHTELALLGEVLEQASGKAMAELLQERIFDPVGMDRSSVHVTNEIGTPVMHAYYADRGFYEDSTFWNPTWARNSGNMNAPVVDVAKWVLALNRGELLTEPAFTQQFAPNTAGLASFTDQTYFTYGMVLINGWIFGNPGLQGYEGFIAQQRDPEVSVVIYATKANGAPETAKRPVDLLGSQITEVMSPTNPVVLPG